VNSVEDRLIDTLLADDTWGNREWLDPVGRISAAFRRRRRRRLAAAVTTTLAVSALATVGIAQLGTGGDAVIRPAGPGQQVVTSSPSAINPALPGKCCVPPPEPFLKLDVRPRSGPAGTVVRILVTGCGVASPQNEATVSFNNDALNVSARNDPNTVRSLGVHRGTRIVLTYTIKPADKTGGTGTFFVQCGQTLIDTRFNVTG